MNKQLLSNAGALLLLLLVASNSKLLAQSTDPVPAPISKDSAWTTGGNFGLFFQQVALSNWAGGGENAIAYGGEVNLYANKRRRNHTWFNSLIAGYGLAKIGDDDAVKNNDLLIIISQYGRNMKNPKWQYSAGVDFRTQFADGFLLDGAADGTDSLISTFMAPGYLSPYIGFTYKPNDNFSATIAPVMQKMTFVLSDELADVGAYGVDPGENFRSEIGWSVTSAYQKEIMKNVNLKANLLLFGAYEDQRHIDVNLDVFLNFKVNEYITTNFSVQAIYDHDIKIEDGDSIGPRLQLRNVLNIGLTYNFGEKRQEE